MPDLNLGDLALTSSAFDHHKRIPDKHTSEGEDVSPPLAWSGAPEGTKSFALVCHDPDAPLADGFTHWVAYNIPGDATSLKEGESAPAEGKNSAGGDGYMGPAPPPDHGKHHYYFWLYALDSELDLEPGLTSRELLDRIDGKIVEQARLIGTFDA